MGVFMYRGLRIGNLRVYVYLAANGKAVCLAFCCTEEAYMVGYLSVFLVEDNIILLKELPSVVP